jgi:maltooligosyltrehalose trehalohydrolase
MEIGALYLTNGRCSFTVWAPCLNQVALEIVHPSVRNIPMEKDTGGYWKVIADDVYPGTQYNFLLDNSRRRPDPASFCQPEGVHGPSEIIDHGRFTWRDSFWKGMLLEKLILYELHAGTFTPEGTFESIINRLHDLKDVGINAIELMPVAQFPGERNWGYDGAYPFAVQNSYGGPGGLKKLVNACHQQDIAVILDVVYNHLGPEGNYLAEYGPYLTGAYRTPWGMAINFDAAYSDGVRNYFIENALYWFRHYHIDALRLDAVHGIYDMSATHFLEELACKSEEFSAQQGRKYYLLAESDLNNPRVIRSRERGGYGIDAQWCDDFHHALHALLTGERAGYYADFGAITQVKKSLEEGYVYSGQYSVFRKRRHGASARDNPASQFIAFSQNHDQVGNRLYGERLSGLVPFEALKLAAGAVILAPFIPLIFMGEEYGEESPFLYFVHHSGPDLIQSVREGRKKEFASLTRDREPPDPQSPETFAASTLRWERRFMGKHNILLRFYQQLIRLRKAIPALSHCDKNECSVSAHEEENIIFMHRWHRDSHVFSILNFNQEAGSAHIDCPAGIWKKLIDSSDTQWMGIGALLPDSISGSGVYTINPFSFIIYST